MSEKLREINSGYEGLKYRPNVNPPNPHAERLAKRGVV